MKTTQLFRSNPYRGFGGTIDAEAGEIRGAVIMQAGPIKDGRPWDVDFDTLSQVAAGLDNAKARFTHPSMSNDGFGKMLGRWRNPRVDGDRVLADLKFSTSASRTPTGDLAAYVLELAQEDPSAFGVSIVADLDESMFDDTTERKPLRITKLRAADFVDEPAATHGLFDFSDARNLPAVVSHLITEHFGDATPDEVAERVCALLSKHFAQEFHMTTTVTPAPVPEAKKADERKADEFLTLFGDRGARWFLEGKTLTESYSIALLEAREEIATLQAAKAELEVQLAAAQQACGEKAALSQALTPAPQPNDKKAKLAQDIEDRKKRGVPDTSARWAAGMSALNGSGN